MAKNHYIPGEFNVICDVCSKKIKAHQAKHRWDGFIVCPEDFEYRHPQDFIQSKLDKIVVPFSRPIPTEPAHISLGAFDINKREETISISIDFARSFTDTLTQTEFITLARDYLFSDNNTWSETLAKSISKALTDSNILTEQQVFSISKSLTDSNAWLDGISISKTIALTDSLSHTESGSVTIPAYALDYFAQDYTETTRTF